MQLRRLSSHALALAAVCAAGQLALADGNGSPPVCSNGGPYLAECQGGLTYIPVNGGASYDPDGTPLTFFWFEECPVGYFEDPTKAQTSYVFDMTGLCHRYCDFELRVTSGGQLKKCWGFAQVDDTSAPTIAAPADVVALYGIDTSVNGTGDATAVDTCDPAPQLQVIDTPLPTTGVGSEGGILRQWVATDRCGHQSTASQTITLLSPAAGAHNLELDVTTCTDVLTRSLAGQYLYVTVLGRNGTLVSALNPVTLRLAKLGDSAHSVAPTNPFKFPQQEIAVQMAQTFADCNPQGVDGKKDLKLEFDYQQVRTTLGLDAYAPGSQVYLMVHGRRWNGTPYMAAGVITVQ